MYQIYFIWSNTVHVSDGLSVHHQEFKTVHTVNGICQTDTADSRQYTVVHTVDFTIEIYYDARPYGRQITVILLVEL